VNDWRENLVEDDAALTRILRDARTVAVLGAKADPDVPAHYVPAYLLQRGYAVRAVNPVIAGHSIFGAPAVATLADLTEPVEVIEVFRRPANLSAHAAEILDLPWRPQAVWFQLGIRHDGAAERLARVGIQVVQDRCMMPEHRRLIGRG
jgi:predicted CoA-binding protein